MRFGSIRMQENRQSITASNPYEDLYRSYNLKHGELCTRTDAESIARHLGYLHNVFGIVVKDFINIIKYRFPEDDKSSMEPMIQQRQQKVSDLPKMDQQNESIKWREQYTVVEHKTVIKKKQYTMLPDEESKLRDTEVRNTLHMNKKDENQEQKENVTSFNPVLFQYKPDKIPPNESQGGKEHPLTQAYPERTKNKNNVIQLDDSQDS